MLSRSRWVDSMSVLPCFAIAARRQRVVWGAAAVVGWLACSTMVPQPTRAAEPDQQAIEQMVERLGSDQYATRVRAREDLQRLGLQAMEVLQQMQHHPDSEVAFAVRSLMDSMMGNWWTERDSPTVRHWLNEYGSLADTEKQVRIDGLASLPRQEGWNALARLARYEPNSILSSRAALAILRAESSVSHREWLDLKDPRNRGIVVGSKNSFAKVVEGSNRPACQWLAAYAAELDAGQVRVEHWQPLFDAQRAAAKSDEQREQITSVHRELLRLAVKRAGESGDREAAMTLVRRNIELIPPRSRELLSAVSWIVDAGLYPLVLELNQRHPRLFAEHPLLLYSTAEAHSTLR